MSTDELKRDVDQFLKQLNVQSLFSSHNSIHISFKQMQSFIDTVIESHASRDGSDTLEPLHPDVQVLLETYRLVAEKFYAQFERSLLHEIKKLRNVQEDASCAIESIEKLRSNDPNKVALERVHPLLVEAYDVAGAKYSRLVDDFPKLMQRALDKLRDEWLRLNTFAVASRRITEDEKLDQSLRAVVEVAAHSIGLEVERIVIVPGNTFALYFFAYLDNLAILTVPIYSVRLPWEWSIFWHELAGYKVRRMERSSTIETMRTQLTKFHDLYKSLLEEEKRQDLLNSVAWKNVFGKNYLTRILKERLQLEDLGGFDHQFERMMLGLTNVDKFQKYDQIKAMGWCVHWFKELFEDAWSVLAIGKPFLLFFDDILKRHAATDLRHPPQRIRLSVAKEILKLADPELEIENQPEPVEVFAAQQILILISLVRAARFQPENASNDEGTDYGILHQGIRDQVLAQVSDGIRSAITNWSEKYLLAATPTRRITNSSNDLIEILSDPILQQLLSLLPKPANLKKSRRQDLLNDAHGDPRDYKQLLELSFYETDFGLSTTTYTFSYNGNGYSITEPSLNACTGTFIFASEVAGTFQFLSVGTTSYWTTGPNIERMKADKFVT